MAPDFVDKQSALIDKALKIMEKRACDENRSAGALRKVLDKLRNCATP